VVIARAALGGADATLGHECQRQVALPQASRDFEGLGVAPLIAQRDHEFVEGFRTVSRQDMSMAEADERRLGLAEPASHHASHHASHIVIREAAQRLNRFRELPHIPKRAGKFDDRFRPIGMGFGGRFEACQGGRLIVPQPGTEAQAHECVEIPWRVG
jgi:hypothetical protein